MIGPPPRSISLSEETAKWEEYENVRRFRPARIDFVGAFDGDAATLRLQWFEDTVITIERARFKDAETCPGERALELQQGEFRIFMTFNPLSDRGMIYAVAGGRYFGTMKIKGSPYYMVLEFREPWPGIVDC